MISIVSEFMVFILFIAVMAFAVIILNFAIN